jgi:FkbM family methyltransferase
VLNSGDMIARIKYYLSSIPIVLGQVVNWHELLLLPLTRRPLLLRLRSGLTLKVRSLMDVWIVKETCLDRTYEVYGTPIGDQWTVIDIGAGIGDFAVMAAREHPSARVFAFEPFPESFEILQANIALNAATNIIPLPTAIGSQSGQKVLATTGQAVQHTTTGSTVSGSATATLEVQCLCLDDVFRAHGLSRCDFLKMDCEGSEYDILFSASGDTLAKIQHLCMEYHDGFTRYTHHDLVRHLQENGFAVRTAQNPVHAYLGYLHARRL